MTGSAGRFRRSDRLLHARDFQRVMREGVRAASDEFVVLISPRRVGTGGGGADEEAAVPASRLGITVSRKVGNAVTRSLIKRRVREWFRSHCGRLDGMDLVVIARQAAASATYADSLRTLTRLQQQSLARVSA